MAEEARRSSGVRVDRPGKRWWLLLLLLVGAGFVARIWNIDFDQRQHLHPDERHWSLTASALETATPPSEHGTLLGPALDWLDGDRSPAAVYRVTDSFVYGPAPLALSRATAGWLDHGVRTGAQPASAITTTLDRLGIPLLDAQGQPRFDSGYQVDLIGRLLGAIVDSLTIVVVALIGRRLGGRRADLAGLVAGGLYASCVLAVQHAHYLGSEPFLGFACALVVLTTLRLRRGPDLRASLTSGLAVGAASGAAMAMKLSALPLVAVPAIGCTVLLLRHRRRSDVLRLLGAGLGAVVAFRMLHPGAFDGLGMRPSSSFMADISLARRQSSVDMPPAIQWADRTPLLDTLRWMFLFTVGPGITLLAIAGATSLLGPGRWPFTLRRQRWAATTTVASAALPLLVAGRGFVHSGRYTMPMLPALCALGAVGVVALARVARRSPQVRTRRVTAALGVGLLGVSALWAVAFVNGVFGADNTRIAATRWIVDNVPPGSGITSEAWDDGLPLALPGVDLSLYRGVQLELVGTDSVAKMTALAERLQTVDFVIESSPRLWATAPRIPSRFPSTIEFFEALDDGSIGFTRAATFDADPRLGPFRLDDSSAEEAFSIYDHPEVRIWRRTEVVDTRTIVERLDPVAAANAVNTHATDAGADGLLLSHDVVANLADGTTYDEQFDTHGSGLAHAIGWLILLELFAAATFVLLLPLLRSLPDAGLGVSKILSLTLLSIGSFVATAWLGVPLGRIWCAAATACLLGAGALAARRRRRELRALWTRRRTLLVGAELVGLLAFALVLWLRAANPDLWHPARGGEKPFEMALMTALLRSDTVAPYDPWFSGGSLNYYYGGWLLLLVPAKLLRTAPPQLMNIALAVFASSVAGAAWSVGAAVTDLGRRSGLLARRTVLGAAFAVVLVMAASNMDVIAPAWSQFLGSSSTFDWWSRSRVIPDSVAITEFPAWSFLFGDLHPHVMGIAVLLALAAVALGLRDRLLHGSRSGAVAAAVFTGLIVGQIRATNTWDLLLAVSIVAVALVSALAPGASRRLTALAAGCTAATLVIVWGPYVRQTVVFDSGVAPGQLFTPLHSWLEQFGLFFAVSLLAVLLPLRTARRGSESLWWRLRITDAVVAGTLLVAGGLTILMPHRVVAVLCTVSAIALAWAAHATRRRRRIPSLALLTLAGGWTIQVFVELFTISNDGGRQNTVFKFWYQSWILLAVGSAAVLATSLPGSSGRPPADRMRRLVARAAFALAAVAGLTTVAFWAYAVPPRLDDRLSTGGLSLDGEAYLDVPFEVGVTGASVVPAEDRPLIDWLRANVSGVRAIAESPGADYQWTSRFSWSTGLPTPIGWPYHESQQRRTDVDVLERRAADMQELYSTTDPTAITRVLANRKIEFVVFGTIERAFATPEARTALVGHPCLEVEWTGDDGSFVAAVDIACVREMRPLGG